jgi:undecaprenyl-diphosphatase
VEHWLAYLQAALLGVVEGVTEFLPISSTGHLIVAIDMLGFKAPAGAVFEVVIQLGAILAVCWYYRVRLIDTVVHFLSSAEKRRFAWLIAVAFLPSVVIGLAAHDIIKSLFSTHTVAIMLVTGGVAILIIEKIKPEASHDDVDKFSYKLALLIGCFQVLAMVPGVSRSGATIMGALMLGATRKAAAEFSFFLAIPTMFGATFYDLYKNRDALSMDDMSLIAVGFATAFISGLMAVKWLLRFLEHHDFKGFAYYRIVVGGALLIWMTSAASSLPLED